MVNDEAWKWYLWFRLPALELAKIMPDHFFTHCVKERARHEEAVCLMGLEVASIDTRRTYHV